MADAWDEYIRRVQGNGSSQTPQSSDNPLSGLLSMFGSLGSGSGGIRPDSRGMYTPSIGQMPVGPPTPINYGGIRALLNSGVLRTGNVPAPVTPPPETAEPSAPAPQANPLANLLRILGGMK